MATEVREWQALDAKGEIVPGYWRAYASTVEGARMMIVAKMQRRSEFVLLRTWRNEGAKVQVVQETEK